MAYSCYDEVLKRHPTDPALTTFYDFGEKYNNYSQQVINNIYQISVYVL